MNWESIKEMLNILTLLDQLDNQEIERDYPIGWEKVHATSCAQIGRMLAEKRGVETEAAALACALHDIGRWVTGRQQGHAPKGEEPVRKFLEDKTMPFEVKEQIVQAVINHSKKEETGSPLEEIVKDADLLDCYWYGDVIEKPFHKGRLNKALEDLGIRGNTRSAG